MHQTLGVTTYFDYRIFFCSEMSLPNSFLTIVEFFWEAKGSVLLNWTVEDLRISFCIFAFVGEEAYFPASPRQESEWVGVGVFYYLYVLFVLCVRCALCVSTRMQESSIIRVILNHFCGH